MAYDLPDCPKCGGVKSLEHIAHGWFFCNGCAWRIEIDKDGNVRRTLPK